MKAKLVNDALLMALGQRKPKKGLIQHSDRGSQYASKSQREIIRYLRLIQSTNRGGIVGTRLCQRASFIREKSSEQIKKGPNSATGNAVHIEQIKAFYNRKRLYSTNDYDHQQAMRIYLKLRRRVSQEVLTHQEQQSTDPEFLELIKKVNKVELINL